MSSPSASGKANLGCEPSLKTALTERIAKGRANLLFRSTDDGKKVRAVCDIVSALFAKDTKQRSVGLFDAPAFMFDVVPKYRTAES